MPQPSTLHTNRRVFLGASTAFAATLVAAGALTAIPARAADDAPDVFIQQLSTQVLDTIKANKNALQNGDLAAIMKIVDDLIMPNIDFTRMTASAVGPGWRRATPDQKQKLQAAFKTLLIRTYAGALKQVGDQTVELRPFRGNPAAPEVVVQTLVHGKGDPVQLDYRLERTPGQGSGWKIYDLNVLGVWLVDNYRPQFAQQINSGGIDALIQAMDARNNANAAQ
ncbi:MAG: ABC transporter substrate-binding protein [Burkholderiaceae bacterium]|jgi:phospholipid transport system substrate-binding protein|nr:ABC transporter substrate-binding protein [Burkholderiaceae bacterium]